MAVGIFGFGTAYIFLKLECVKRARIATHTMMIWYALGFLFAGLVTLLIRVAVGLPVAVALWGGLGGIIWAAGKTCAFHAVRSELGMAQTVAIQCPVAMVVTFFSGVFAGEGVKLVRYLGLVLVLAGLFILLASRSEWMTACLSKAGVEATPLALEDGEQAGQAATLDVGRGAVLAVLGGFGLGMHVLPVKFSHADIWSYSIALAIGEFLLFASTAGTLLAVDVVKGRARFGLSTGLPAGLLGGSMLFVAAAAIAVAADLAGLAFTAMKDMNMIVAGLWGILVFKEITNAYQILVFAGGSLVALSGAAVMAFT